jgi:O-antigen ligase
MVRVATYKAGINMIKDHPILGVGAGNFNPLFDYYRPPELAQYGAKGTSIHNIFLQIFSETGNTGGIIFMLIIFGSFVGLWKLRRRNKKLPLEKRVNLAAANVAGISLLGFCGAGFFLPGAYYSYIYIVFALIMASKEVYSKLLDEAEKSS